MSGPLAVPRFRLFTPSGAPAVGAKVFTYTVNTTTKKATYTDHNLNVANANPTVCDANGECALWGADTYKIVAAPSTDTDPPSSPYWTMDYVPLGVSTASTTTASEWIASGLTATYVSATSFTLAADQTATFVVGRRLQSANTGGTVYSTILTSSYSSGTGLTTVTVVNDSTPLDSGMASPSYSLIKGYAQSVPLPQVSVRAFGAVGDGVTSDAAAITAAIAYGRANFVEIYFPAGNYYTGTTSFELLNGAQYGCAIRGQSRYGTRFSHDLTTTTPLFKVTGLVGGTPTNVALREFSVVPNTNYTGTAIQINSAVGVKVEGIIAARSNYGLWLYNNQTSGFTEAITVRDCWFDYCQNGIRMEQGSGATSFNGCVFEGVYGNADGALSQIFWNFVSGYYYNGRFDLHVWTHTNGTVFNNGGLGEKNSGSIHVEMFTNGRITASANATFSYCGELTVVGTGSFTDSTGNNTAGQPNFCCTNYFKSTAFTDVNIGTANVTAPGQVGMQELAAGAAPILFRVNGASVDSVALNTIPGNGNGLFITNTAINSNVKDALAGWFISSNGNVLETFATAQATFEISGSRTMAFHSNGDLSLGKNGAATNMTTGFMHIPIVAGTPSGTPTTITGFAPIVLDSSAGKLWAYYGAAWHYAALT